MPKQDKEDETYQISIEAGIRNRQGDDPFSYRTVIKEGGSLPARGYSPDSKKHESSRGEVAETLLIAAEKVSTIMNQEIQLNAIISIQPEKIKRKYDKQREITDLHPTG